MDALKDEIKDIVEYKIRTLIDLMLTDGVKPSELADNIFLDDYKAISFQNDGENIIGVLTFLDNENKSELISMKYYYSYDKKVMKITEIIEGKENVLWDRNLREEEILEEILLFMKQAYNKEQIIKFIQTLPDSLRSKLIYKLSVA